MMFKNLLACICLLISSCAAMAASPVPANGVISAPGEYYLTANRGSGGANYALLISASSVDLDLRGFTVSCSAPSPSTQSTFGVIAHYQSNVTVRNGKVTGCVQGVSVLNTVNATVEAVDFTGVRMRGVFGNDAVTGLKVRGSTFKDIAGFSSQAYALGIDRPGANCVIENNVFKNLKRQPGIPVEAVGEGVAVIFSPDAAGCRATGNWIENADGDDHLEIGFWVGNATVTLSENTFTNIGRGIAISPGYNANVTDNRFWMRDPQAGSYAIGAQQGTAAGNVIIGYDDPLLGAIADGGNTILP